MKKRDLKMRKSGLQTAIDLLKDRDLTKPEEHGKALEELENKGEELEKLIELEEENMPKIKPPTTPGDDLV